MKYKNVIIKCNNTDEYVRLQEYLFKYKYSWRDNGVKHRHIKRNIIGLSYIIINNDDILNLGIDFLNNFHKSSRYRMLDYISIERKVKLEKIKNV